MQRGCDKESGVGGKSAVSTFQRGCDMEISFGVQIDGLTLEHRRDKESVVLLKNNVNNFILNPKEKKVLHNNNYTLKKKKIIVAIESRLKENSPRSGHLEQL